MSLRTFRSVDLANGGSVDWTTSTWPTNAPAGDLTQWIYNSVGLLERKRYADNSEVVYAYDTALRVASKTNARNQVATYTYDSTKSGQLTGTSYSSGSATPAVAFAYDRALRVIGVSDATGSRTLGYAATGQMNSETYSGLLAGQSIGRTFVDGRPETLTAGSAYSARWSYDSLGRPQTYTGETGAFAGLAVGYGYQTGSNRIASTTWSSGGIAKSYATRSYDALGRLTDITTRIGDPAGSSSIARRFGYSQFDALDRRQVVEGEDGGRWNYAYNDRGEVRSAQRRDVSNTVLPGHSYAYDFDTIGNRTSSSGQGNSSYTANALNQYSQRTVAGEIGVLGTAASDAIVSADFQRMARTGEWFSGVLTVSNSSAPVWKSFDVVAVRNNAGASGEDMVASATKTAFVAKTPEVFTHDSDGNLIADGRWTYTWDAENRLLSMETNGAAVAAGAPRQRLEFTYDAQSRRARKVVKSWTGSAFATQSDTRFLYDNWNLVAELDGLAANAVTRSHAWGLDLSGSLQGAGGVGGLLAVRTGSATYTPAQDGNGNITGLIDLGTDSLAARYEYGPFGETILASGPAATATPWRFSSKYAEPESGLLYYGSRYYNPATGRWLSRDPIHERGGVNLYGMVGNSPVNYWDFLGMFAPAPVPVVLPPPPPLPPPGGIGVGTPGGYVGPYVPDGYPGGAYVPLPEGPSEPGYALDTPEGISSALARGKGAPRIEAPAGLSNPSTGTEQQANELRQKLARVRGKTKLDPGEACSICPKIQGSGWITYLSPWENFPGGPQAKGVVGMITAQTPEGSSASVNPKGWAAISDIVGSNRARGHLLARFNGGSGSSIRNIVPLEQNPFNNSTMKRVEYAMYSARQRSTVCFFIMPTYRGTRGDQGIPSSVNMIWVSSDGEIGGGDLNHAPGSN